MSNVKNIEQQSLYANRQQPTIIEDCIAQMPIVVHKKTVQKATFLKPSYMQRIFKKIKFLFLDIRRKTRRK